MSGWGVTTLDETVGAGGWAPLRRHFDVGAFGVNAWRGDEAGAVVIPEHHELETGHEELYVVVAGSATFTVDGETVPGPTGTIVFVRDPAVRRAAVADVPGTTLLTVGAKRGEVFEPSAWEDNYGAILRFNEGDWEGGRQLLLGALERRPDSAVYRYNLACAEARLGEREAAIGHLLEAAEAEARFREAAQTDEDLASLRDDPRFPTLK
ncbi:MAG TPA: hypothetical protein VK874_17525 [Gaiellaceae bacterium]|nr:hypothetical protein [Gaiellaceae bacterium]